MKTARTLFALFFLASSSLTYAATCPNLLEDGKWLGGKTDGSPAYKYKIDFTYECNDKYETVCTSSTCYNSWWDELFGSGHKCNEVCKNKLVGVDVSYSADIKYYISASEQIDLKNVTGKAKSEGWYRFYKQTGSNKKNGTAYWVRVKSNNDNKLELTREVIENDKVVSSKSHTLTRD